MADQQEGLGWNHETLLYHIESRIASLGNLTEVRMREHVDGRFKDLERLIDIHVGNIKEVSTLAKEATSIAKAAQEKRFEASNEIRGAMEDRERRLASRDSVEAIEKDMTVLKEERGELRGKASQMSVNFSYLIGFAGLAVGIISLFLK